MTTRLEAAEQYFFGQRLRDVLLDHPRHRPSVHLLVIAARDQPFRLLELFPQNYHVHELPPAEDSACERKAARTGETGNGKRFG
jgi:hypothetical protein